MKNNIIIFYIFFVLILLYACGSKIPIPEDVFVKVYADMTIMQDTSSLSQIKIRDAVLKKFNYTQKDFDKTISYFNEDSERWSKFFDKVVNYLEDQKSKFKKTQPLALPRRYVLMDN